MIAPLVRSTWGREVIGEFGAFGGFYAPEFSRFRSPVLVASTDGVGTKLKIAQALGKHDTVGIDLVAMCVNDICVHGARPLFFLDYIATGRLEPRVVADIVRGVVEGCREAGCALIGGETAEMPGFYGPDQYDLAGFAVGIVERDCILGAHRVEEDNVLLGIPSSGLHSNGFSLARKILLDVLGYGLDDYIPELGKSLGEELLAPTKIYARLMAELADKGLVRAAAHITGGGIVDNLVRCLPEGMRAVVQHRWVVPPVFRLIEEAGKISRREMYRTFNMGVGLILVVDRDHADRARDVIFSRGETCFDMGYIEEGERAVVIGEG